MKINCIISAILLLLVSDIYAQQVAVADKSIADVPTLKVGNELPDVLIPHIFHSTKKTAHTSDYKNQLLILDFWATSCSGCVEGLPRMDLLQKEFGSKIVVLPVTYEKEEQVKAFWTHNPLTRGLSLPSVVEDQLLQTYFRHRVISHEAWIYKGKIVAITEGDYVDAVHIRQVLAGGPINFPVKDDYYVFDGYQSPLFSPDPNQIDTTTTAMQYSAISDYREGATTAGEGIVRNMKRKTIRAFFLNRSIYNAYLSCWRNVVDMDSLEKPGGVFVNPNQVVWDVVDKNKYKYISKELSGYLEDWNRQHSICFELLKPDNGQSDKAEYQGMILDMDRLLGLHVRWEKRQEKVLVLVRTTTDDRLKSKARINPTTIYDNLHEIKKGNVYRLRDWPLPNLADRLNNQASNPYVFDKTGYENPVDMDLNIPSWTDIPAIRKAIQPYGLDLKEEERLVDKFVFSEVNGGLLIDPKLIEVSKKRLEAQKDMKDPTTAENNAFLEANKKKPGVVTLPSGLQYKIIKEGTGPKPTINNKIIVNYTCMLVNGKIFGSSMEMGRPSVFPLNELFKGWQEALPQMPVGSKWILYVPAALAYGEHTGQHMFPPNSNMIFEVELLKIERL